MRGGNDKGCLLTENNLQQQLQTPILNTLSTSRFCTVKLRNWELRPQVRLQLRELLEQTIEGQTNKDENLDNCVIPWQAPSIVFKTKRKEERGLNLEPMWDYLARRVALSCKRGIFSVIITNGGEAGQCLLQTITAIPREACKIRASRIDQDGRGRDKRTVQ